MADRMAAPAPAGAMEYARPAPAKLTSESADRLSVSADASSTGAICSLKKEQGLPLSAVRAMGLDVAAKMLGGNKKLGDILDITARAVAYKSAGDRGIADDEVITTAEALEALAVETAGRLNGHAAKLRALVTR